MKIVQQKQTHKQVNNQWVKKNYYQQSSSTNTPRLAGSEISGGDEAGAYIIASSDLK